MQMIVSAGKLGLNFASFYILDGIVSSLLLDHNLPFNAFDGSYLS